MFILIFSAVLFIKILTFLLQKGGELLLKFLGACLIFFYLLMLIHPKDISLERDFEKMKAPNILTLVRIGLSPVFIVFFMINNFWSLLVCIGLFAILEITDLLDGRIARKYGQITDFGKLMDPYADSISRFTIFLSFLSVGLAPLWVIAIFFYRDVLVSVIRVFSIKEGVVVAARKSGKTKAWVQALGISLVLLLLLLQKTHVYANPLTVSHIQVTAIIIFLAAMVTLWSAIDYWNGNKSVVLDAMRMKENS